MLAEAMIQDLDADLLDADLLHPNYTRQSS